ncbi:unnamed protein product [Scytosiphon promiscuus]
MYRKVSTSDGTWLALETEWRQACDNVDEDFDDFEMGSFDVLRTIANNCDDSTFTCVVPSVASTHAAASMANYVHIKGYSEKVLRIRHLTFSPQLDFTSTYQDYVNNIASVLAAILTLSKDMKAKHVKVHAASPADNQLLNSSASGLRSTKSFTSVDFKGSWLYITF